MNDLLTVEDERDLTAFLVEHIGAKLLLSDVAQNEEPAVADDPLAALPVCLPERLKFGREDIFYLIFWLPACGPIKTMRTASIAASVSGRVSRLLTRDAAYAAGGDDDDIIDQERTPIVKLSRSTRLTSNRLAPGVLQSMPLKRQAIPKDALEKYLETKRWLKRRGAKVDPFAHCPEVRERRPKNLGALWVYAQPYAMKLVLQGMEIWPWNR
jgi:hypothetical protein